MNGLHPLFIEARHGHRFALHHAPQGAANVARPHGLVVYVHPLAEELNKSRRMAALQSRSLAQQGWAVLQIDLLGCGDSSGELVHSRWGDWLEDVILATRWLRDRYPAAGEAPLYLWGLRAGALIAVHAAIQHAKALGPCNFLFWQPTLNGRSALQPLQRAARARMWVDASPPNQPSPPAAPPAQRPSLHSGAPLVAAGYTVAAELIGELQAAELMPPAVLTRGGGPAPRVIWLQQAAIPSPADTLQGWEAAGWHVELTTFQGPPFWQTQETEEAPHLLELCQQHLAHHLIAQPTVEASATL